MPKTAQTPREKRPYIKKRLLTQDELWKLIVPLLWQPFIHFCLEDWADKIDFSRKPDFLDKDLKRFMPRGKSKNRTVDFLIRLYLKDGTTKCFLFHIEIQAYFDAEFGKRVFQYFYRISDALQEPIETLVIMIDEDPNYRPNSYKQVFGQTSVEFKFRMFKLLDNPPPYIGKEGNPFAIAFEVAWYALKQNKLKTDDDLKALRFNLIKRLLKQKVNKEEIEALLDFINIYLPFADSEKEGTFVQELDLLINKDINMEPITIRQYYENKVQSIIEKLQQKADRADSKRLEANAKRLEETAKRLEADAKRLEAERGLTTAVHKLYVQGMPVETIADTISRSIAFVQDIINKKD